MSRLCFCCYTAPLLPNIFFPLNVLIISSVLVSSLTCLGKLFWIFNVTSHIFLWFICCWFYSLTLGRPLFSRVSNSEESYFCPYPSLTCILSHFLLISTSHQSRPVPRVSPDKCLFSGAIHISLVFGQGFASRVFRALTILCQVWNTLLDETMNLRRFFFFFLIVKWGGPDHKVWSGFQDR